jgi:chorismate mutase
MIESHYAPGRALSDAGQQLTPKALHKLLNDLDFREDTADATAYSERLETMRDQVDSIDAQLIELLSQRMKVVEKIGAYKKKHNLAIVQVKRWSDILGSRIPQGKRNGLSRAFLNKMLQSIHEESIRKQTLIFKDRK